MKKIIVICLPKNNTANKNLKLCGEWIDHIYTCGISDIRPLNDFKANRKGELILEVKTNLMLWSPNKLNDIYSPEGLAMYMSKRMYKKYFKGDR